MKDAKRLRNSTLIEFLCDENHRILNVLKDLLGIEIPDNANIRFLQDTDIHANPLVITHVCVVVNSDAYIVMEDPVVLDPLEFRDCYGEICALYGELLEQKSVKWTSIMPIILSTSGLIRLPNSQYCACEKFIPAIDVIGADITEGVRMSDYPSPPSSLDECDETWPNPVRWYLQMKPRYNECFEGKISETYSSDEQKELLCKIYPDLEAEVIDKMLQPLPGVFVARHTDSIGGPWEIRIFDVTSAISHGAECECDGQCAVCPIYNQENYALVVSDDLRHYVYGRRMIEHIQGHPSKEELDAYMASYMAEEIEDEFRDFLRLPESISNFWEELSLFEYVIFQRQSASLCAQAQAKQAIESLHNLI